MMPRLAVMAGPGPAEREDQAADLQVRVVAPLHGWDRHILESEHGQVGGGIPAGEGGRGGPAAREGDADVLVARDRVTGGDQDPRTPDDAGRGNAPPRVDGDHRAADLLDGGRQIVGETSEHAHGMTLER